MFDDPIGLDGALRAAPLTPSAAPIVSSSSWLEQQELAEVLEEQLTELEALEAIEVSKRQYSSRQVQGGGHVLRPVRISTLPAYLFT